jgi:hypothetical protein
VAAHGRSGRLRCVTERAPDPFVPPPPHLPLSPSPTPPQEDAHLLALVAQHGTSDWKRVSASFPSRTTKQCRDRFVQHLSPSVDKSPWQAGEERLLFVLQAELGSRWTVVARYLPGRSESSAKNHYYSAIRRVERFHKVSSAAAADLLAAYARASTTPEDAALVRAVRRAVLGTGGGGGGGGSGGGAQGRGDGASAGESDADDDAAASSSSDDTGAITSSSSSSSSSSRATQFADDVIATPVRSRNRVVELATQPRRVPLPASVVTGVRTVLNNNEDDDEEGEGRGGGGVARTARLSTPSSSSSGTAAASARGGKKRPRPSATGVSPETPSQTEEEGEEGRGPVRARVHAEGAAAAVLHSHHAQPAPPAPAPAPAPFVSPYAGIRLHGGPVPHSQTPPNTGSGDAGGAAGSAAGSAAGCVAGVASGSSSSTARAAGNADGDVALLLVMRGQGPQRGEGRGLGFARPAHAPATASGQWAARDGSSTGGEDEAEHELDDEKEEDEEDTAALGSVAAAAATILDARPLVVSGPAFPTTLLPLRATDLGVQSPVVRGPGRAGAVGTGGGAHGAWPLPLFPFSFQAAPAAGGISSPHHLVTHRNGDGMGNDEDEEDEGGGAAGRRRPPHFPSSPSASSGGETSSVLGGRGAASVAVSTGSSGTWPSAALLSVGGSGPFFGKGGPGGQG